MKKLIRRLLLLLIVFGLCFLGYYVYAISPEDYEFHEQKYISSLVSSQLNGFKIAFISDVNLTDQDSITRFEKIVDELNEYPFDMVKMCIRDRSWIICGFPCIIREKAR